jgi:hypothetical protein
MANTNSRGGQKEGRTSAGESKKHRGVRPGSTNQKKGERQKQAEKKAGLKTRVVGEPPVPDDGD